MSYILDALRRAEEERREQQTATELHDQVVAPPTREQGASAFVALGPWVVAAVCVAIAGAVGAYAWQMQSHTAPESGTAAPIGQVAATPAAMSVAPPVGAPATPPAPTPVAPATAAPTAAPATTTPGLATPAPTPVAQASVAAPPPAPNPAPANAQAPAPQATAVVQAEPPVLSFASLPDDIRRALPPMTFDGTIYSEDPASRMLMINGQLLREGEAFTADVRVEQIKPRSAILSYRGRRFEFMRQ